MCKADIERIKEFISNNLNETMYLDKWYIEVNKVLPKNRKLTKRELASVFSRKLGEDIEVERFKEPIQYRFSPSAF